MSAGRWVEVLVLAPHGLDAPAADEWAGTCASELARAGSLGCEQVEREGRAGLRAYFSTDTVAAGAARALREAGVAAEVGPASEVVDPGWVEAFNASLRPVDVGRRFTIVPGPEGDAGAGRVALRVVPGRAFGTGHHASTRLALEWLEEVVRPGDRVLDAGTGSGILAMACAALGASRVEAFDVDSEAIEVARENVGALDPGARGVVALAVRGAPPPGEHDVVVANIQADVILPMLSALVAATARGGALVLSGLLDADESRVASALAAHGLTTSWRRDGEWSSACSRR